jgi:hypothetical protein
MTSKISSDVLKEGIQGEGRQLSVSAAPVCVCVCVRGGAVRKAGGGLNICKAAGLYPTREQLLRQPLRLCERGTLEELLVALDSDRGRLSLVAS